MKAQIKVLGNEITIGFNEKKDYISLTDIAKFKDLRTDYIIQNWLRKRGTIEFLGLWEKINNTLFNPIEFEGFRDQAGLNALFIKEGLEKSKRLEKLNKIAIEQMTILTKENVKRLK